MRASEMTIKVKERKKERNSEMLCGDRFMYSSGMQRWAVRSAVAMHILKRKSHGGKESCRENPQII
jgi:hypothetical protein